MGAARLRHFILRRGRAIGLFLVTVMILGMPIGGLTRQGPGRLIVFALFMMLLVATLGAWLRWQRERYIREQPLPQFLKRKLREAYPHLQQKDTDLVERGLRQFFLACHRSNKKFVAMPSRVVDAMWHEFILHTQAY